LTPSTCQNYATVARAFAETSRRRDVLSFSHHQAVARLSPEDADKMLDWCVDGIAKGQRRSVSDLYVHIRIYEQEQTIKAYSHPPTARQLLKWSKKTISTIERGPLSWQRLQDPDPEPPIALDDSAVGGPVPDELHNLQIEPPPQPDHVAIARAAVAKLSSDETIALIGEWADRASVEQRRSLFNRIHPQALGGEAGMIELVAIIAFIIACRRLRRSLREPRRIDVHVYHHGLPGGPGERSPVFFEYPTDPTGNVVPFPQRPAA
jgi:hypothetical protein